MRPKPRLFKSQYEKNPEEAEKHSGEHLVYSPCEYPKRDVLVWVKFGGATVAVLGCYLDYTFSAGATTLNTSQRITKDTINSIAAQAGFMISRAIKDTHLRLLVIKTGANCLQAGRNQSAAARAQPPPSAWQTGSHPKRNPYRAQ